MDCPRCNLTLSKDKYEGLDVRTCATCAGYWLEAARLEKAVATKGYRWSKDEAWNILYAIAQANEGGKKVSDEEIVCPQCGGKMVKFNFRGKSGITLDRCSSDHGVWLDTGEMKRVQVWAEAEAGKGAKKK